MPAASETALRKTTIFALGGVGYAGIMSEGERTLREILKEADAAKRLESVLPNASAAGQLYALLGLRLARSGDLPASAWRMTPREERECRNHAGLHHAAGIVSRAARANRARRV